MYSGQKFAKYCKDTLMALGGADYTKYALLTPIQYVQWLKIGLVKIAINLSKNIFSSLNFLMHIFNISVTYLQSIKRIH